MTNLSVRDIIKAFLNAGPDAGPLVLAAIEAWKRGCYGKAYQGPPGPEPAPGELSDLTVGLIRWGDRYLPIDLTPLQRFHEVNLRCIRRAARDPAFDMKSAQAQLDETLGEADGTLNRVVNLLSTHSACFPKQKAMSPRPQRNVLVSLGAKQYAIGKHRPIAVTPSEDKLLQAFLNTSAMTDPTLKAKTALDDPGKVLRRLRTKYDGIFAPAITPPGGKGKGGYQVHIIFKAAVSTSY